MFRVFFKNKFFCFLFEFFQRNPMELTEGLQVDREEGAGAQFLVAQIDQRRRRLRRRRRRSGRKSAAGSAECAGSAGSAAGGPVRRAAPVLVVTFVPLWLKKIGSIISHWPSMQ